MGRLQSAIIILLFAAITRVAKYFYAYLVFGIDAYRELSVAYRTVLINGTMLLLGLAMTWWFSRAEKKSIGDLLGLNRSAGKACIVAVLCTMPMFLGGALTSSVNENASLFAAFAGAIWPGFFEELIYRAMITGLLIRVAKWAVTPAVLVSAILFGWVHLYQADDMMSAVMVFLLTSLGGIGFALFYKFWNWNLWFPIFMHMFMNLSFVLFEMGNTALMDRNGNIFRAITLLLAIGATIYISYRRRVLENAAVPLPK
jgi:membrane protease YdiL (CAAX protease family)